MVRLWIVIALCALGFWAQPARAAATCAATTMTDAAFGSPTLLPGGSVDTTATLSFSCTGMQAGTYTYCLSLDAGSGGRSGNNRLMTSGGGATITYSFYQDAARSIPWGSRTDPSLGGIPGQVITSNDKPSGTQTIYARVTAGQSTVPPGSYSSSFSGSDVQFYRLDKQDSDCVSGAFDNKAPIVSPGFSATVAPTADCLVSVGSLAFGTTGSLRQPIDATATVGAKCTNGTPYSIALDNGQSGSSPGARKMTDNAAAITYALYLDSARSQLWGGSQTATGTGTGTTRSFTIYGRVPAQAEPRPATYSDNVVVTLSY